MAGKCYINIGKEKIMSKFVGKNIFSLLNVCNAFPSKRVIITNGYITGVEKINGGTEFIIDGVLFNTRQIYSLLYGTNITNDYKVLMHNIFREAVKNEDSLLIHHIEIWGESIGESFVTARSDEWTKSGLKSLYKLS